MIDSLRRKKLAFHLRQLVVGQITNDDFEENICDEVSFGWLPEQYYRSKQAINDDRAIQVILEQCWCLYSDLKKHKLKGEYQLSDLQMKEISRWILFLHSELEYEYSYFDVTNPVTKFSLLDYLLSLLTLGYFYRKKMDGRETVYQSHLKEGDHDYWPFFRHEDYLMQLKAPPFLKG